jgi:hypothetical protein
LSSLHYISVRRSDGLVVARRKGGRPIVVSEPGGWVQVEAPPAAVERGVPARFALRFVAEGQSPRGFLYKVSEARVGPDAIEIDRFQARFAIDDVELGAWARASIERRLDLADKDEPS